ncbi:hypothetical protein HanIR_Chr08g0345211 [Helianthus annuus]|nr:hypothetical protein HanIR_Chr08g0345211 [Helianthus annuus]
MWTHQVEGHPTEPKNGGHGLSCTMSTGMPWRYTISLINTLATVELEKDGGNPIKCPYFDNRSTTTIMTDLPFDKGSPVMKSMEIPSKTCCGKG